MIRRLIQVQPDVRFVPQKRNYADVCLFHEIQKEEKQETWSGFSGVLNQETKILPNSETLFLFFLNTARPKLLVFKHWAVQRWLIFVRKTTVTEDYTKRSTSAISSSYLTWLSIYKSGLELLNGCYTFTQISIFTSLYTNPLLDPFCCKERERKAKLVTLNQIILLICQWKCPRFDFFYLPISCLEGSC